MLLRLDVGRPASAAQAARAGLGESHSIARQAAEPSDYLRADTIDRQASSPRARLADHHRADVHVGAFVGLCVAIPLTGGDWSLLFLGTLASSFTGWLGAFLGWMIKGRTEPARE